MAHEGYDLAKVKAHEGYEIAKDKLIWAEEEAVHLGKEGVEMAKEKLEHGYERAKEGLSDLAARAVVQTRHYYDAAKHKFDQFTHISNEEYQAAKTKLAEIKRQTFEMIDMAKAKGIVLEEDLIRSTKELFAQQEAELEEMALKVRENIENDKFPGLEGEQLRTIQSTGGRLETAGSLPLSESARQHQAEWQDVPISGKRDTGKIWEGMEKKSGEECFQQGVPIREKQSDDERIKAGTRNQYSKRDL
jgi:hypothetical protein